MSSPALQQRPLPRPLVYSLSAGGVLGAMGLCFGFVEGFQSELSQGPLIAVLTGPAAALLGVLYGLVAGLLRFPRWLFGVLLAALGLGVMSFVQWSAH